VVCTDVYAKFPWRPTKKVLLKHGAGVASRILTRSPFRKTIFDFDLVLVNGEADYELLQRVCSAKLNAQKVVATGLPYLDRLHTCAETRDAYLRRIGLVTTKGVALIAPSWRGLEIIQARQPDYFDELIAAVRELDWQVIIKMHACSFNKAMTQGQDWAGKLSRYAERGIGIDNDVDDVPALVHSDLLITDISSRAFNFMLLDKPVVAVLPDELFTDQLDRERITLIERGAFLARSPAEIKLIIAHGLNGHDPLRTERQCLAQRFFANPGRATEAVVAQLLRHLPNAICKIE
jgi:hypothetical protein